MGIQGLFKMLKKHGKNVCTISTIKQKTVAIDIFTYLHKSKGSTEYILNELQPYIENAKHVIAVFDGSPSSERSKSLKSLAQVRSEIINQMKVIQETLESKMLELSKEDRTYLQKYIKSLENESWSPSPKFMWEVYDVLKEKGVECIVLEKGEEADSYLVNLKMDIVISNDSDLLANDVKKLLRPNGEYYEHEDILTGLEFSKEQWHLFIKLCKKMKSTDPEFIFTVMKLCECDEEYIYEKYNEFFM
jgi:hypothetical protein